MQYYCNSKSTTLKPISNPAPTFTIAWIVAPFFKRSLTVDTQPWVFLVGSLASTPNITYDIPFTVMPAFYTSTDVDGVTGLTWKIGNNPIPSSVRAVADMYKDGMPIYQGSDSTYKFVLSLTSAVIALPFGTASTLFLAIGHLDTDSAAGVYERDGRLVLATTTDTGKTWRDIGICGGYTKETAVEPVTRPDTALPRLLYHSASGCVYVYNEQEMKVYRLPLNPEKTLSDELEAARTQNSPGSLVVRLYDNANVEMLKGDSVVYNSNTGLRPGIGNGKFSFAPMSASDLFLLSPGGLYRLDFRAKNNSWSLVTRTLNTSVMADYVAAQTGGTTLASAYTALVKQCQSTTINGDDNADVRCLCLDPNKIERLSNLTSAEIANTTGLRELLPCVLLACQSDPSLNTVYNVYHDVTYSCNKRSINLVVCTNTIDSKNSSFTGQVTLNNNCGGPGPGPGPGPVPVPVPPTSNVNQWIIPVAIVSGCLLIVVIVVVVMRKRRPSTIS